MEQYSRNDEIKILKKEKDNIEKDIRRCCYNIDMEKKKIRSKRKRIKEIDYMIDLYKKQDDE